MRLLWLVGLLVALAACRQSETVNPVQKNWPTEPLNSAYTIQFPTSYQGNGAAGFEGPTFSKYRADGQVQLSYFFCSATFCSEYGQSLTRPVPAFVVVQNKTLGHAILLVQNGQLIGVFYHGDQSTSIGQLYLANGGQLNESLQIQYVYSQQAEVVAILQTIRPK